MSYILEALKKDQGQANSAKPRIEPNAVYTVEKPLTSGQGHFLLWGLLLTFAIFIALLAGYWMGTHQGASHFTSQPNNISKAPAEAVQSSSAAAPQVVPIVNHPEQVKIAAEDYFENPPEPKLEVIKKQEVVEEQPLILGDRSHYDQQNGKAKVEQQKSIDSFDLETLDGVSEELLAKFKSAVSETGQVTKDDSQIGRQQERIEQLRPLTDMPVSIQNAIPVLEFGTHIYSTEGDSWVKVNGKELKEGQWLNNDLQLVEIAPQDVVLAYQGQKFRLAALSSWN